MVCFLSKLNIIYTIIIILCIYTHYNELINYYEYVIIYFLVKINYY